MSVGSGRCPPVQRPVCSQPSCILAAVAVAQHDLLVVVMYAAQVGPVPLVVKQASHHVRTGVKVCQSLKQRHHTQAVGVVRGLASLSSNLCVEQGIAGVLHSKKAAAGLT